MGKYSDLALSLKDPKCDQNLQFTPLSETSIPVTQFIWEFPHPPPPGHRETIDDRKYVCVRWVNIPETFSVPREKYPAQYV